MVIALPDALKFFSALMLVSANEISTEETPLISWLGAYNCQPLAGLVLK